MVGLADPPFGLEAVGRESTVELVLHLAVVVAVVETRHGPQALQVEIGVARLQGVEGPGDQIVAKLERPPPLQLLEGQAEPPAPPLRLDPELVAAEPQPALSHPQEAEDEPDQAARGGEGAGHDPADEV